MSSTGGKRARKVVDLPNLHLTNADGAVVSEEKVVAYLLSHPDGRSKARLFLGLGFSVSAAYPVKRR